MRKSRLRIHGNDRALMMLARDVRRRWLQYGENRKIPSTACVLCGTTKELEVDHIKPVGPRPRIPNAFGDYIERMFYNPCQWLCRKCNKQKRDK